MIFKENFTPIEIELENLKGDLFQLKSQMMPSGKLKEIEKLLKNKELVNTEKTHRIMAEYFGKPEKFWEQFSINLLDDVTQHIQEINKKKLKEKTG